MGHVNGNSRRIRLPFGSHRRRTVSKRPVINRGVTGSALQLARGFTQIAAVGMIVIGGPFAWILRDGHTLAHTEGLEAATRMWNCFNWGTVTSTLLGAMFLLMRLSHSPPQPSQTIQPAVRQANMSDSAPQHFVDWTD